MVDAVNEITHAPMSGSPIDAVVITGDVVGNSQQNELDWYKTILDGGSVTPKSGDSKKSEASHSSQPHNYDVHYYHPDGPPEGAVPDRPHVLHHFPHFKGLLAASEATFRAKGLKHTWLAVHGNHDALLQGTAAPTEVLENLVTGDQKLFALKRMEDLAELFQGFGEVGPAIYPGVDHLETTTVTADSRQDAQYSREMG
jgi:hypothetical protein